jgi:hypothetical protein
MAATGNQGLGTSHYFYMEFLGTWIRVLELVHDFQYLRIAFSDPGSSFPPGLHLHHKYTPWLS